MLGAREAIDGFLRSASRPALFEPGEPLLPVSGDNFICEVRASGVVVQAWDETRNIVRRVTGIREQARGKLVLTVRRFANREGELMLVDLAVPAKREWTRRGERLVFRERFREFLEREFSSWELVALSADPDLEHSLSPAYPRAFLRHGRSGMAAIAAPPELGDASGILSFGLIWFDYLRRRQTKNQRNPVVLERLVILTPEGQERATALRIPYLTNASVQVYAYSDNDRARKLDAADYGNLDTTLDPCRRPVNPNAVRNECEELDSVEGFERVRGPDGGSSLRIHGLEFATEPGGETRSELVVHARELSRLRRDPENPLYRKDAERWLESQVRQHVTAIDSMLRPAPVYGQVPAFTAGKRGVIDLLAVDVSGRLAVLELKAAADIHLPLQALDYWMRVAKYAREEAFSSRGYFPGIALTGQLPRLLLVAPALEFHPSTETVLGFFAPEIEVMRIGLAAQWREGPPRVMFRLAGSASA